MNVRTWLSRKWVRAWVPAHGTAFYWQVEPGGFSKAPVRGAKSTGAHEEPALESE